MLPGAQIAAAIEILEEIQGRWQAGQSTPTDALLASYFRDRRYIGAKDKGFISRRVYTVLRQGGRLQFDAEQLGLSPQPRYMLLSALMRGEGHSIGQIEQWFNGEKHHPKPLSPKEVELLEWVAANPNPDMPEWMALNTPAWAVERLRPVFGEQLAEALDALNEEAPLDLRVNTLKTTREKALAELKKEGFSGEATRLSPWGIRLAKRGAIFNTDVFKKGMIEVQDEGSQLVTLISEAKAGQRVIDFCAGAGGKTLALSAMMQNKGRILAFDTHEHRLEQSAKRIRRAGVDNVMRHVLSSETDTYLKRHRETADVVLVDAPCSGSGTWRRNPDLKWRFPESELEEITATQERIINSAARLVKKGGRLVYITCSLYAEENEMQVEKFLASHPDFSVAPLPDLWDKNGTALSPYLRLAPHLNSTDGFFAAVLHKF